MDKYEFKIKVEQIARLTERRDYKTAAKIADGIDWRKVRNVELLVMISEIYERLDRYEDSYEILNMAYDRAPIGRSIVYKMSELATRMGDFEEAIELYKEFVRIAPHDLSRYALKYNIYKAKGASLTDQIAILEEYKSREYDEKWSYELALLYYREGLTAKCVEECDDLVLWFSEGEYVRKALELKMRIQPLTASQEEKYRTLMCISESSETEEAEAQDAQPESEIQPEESPEKHMQSAAVLADEIRIPTEDKDERFSTINLQAEIATGLKELFDEAEVPVKAVEAPVQPQKKPLTVSPAVGMKTIEPVNVATTFREVNSLRLGQREDGQLTFNEEENILERQITGQLTLDEIMAEWRLKQQQIEADIARAAKERESHKEEIGEIPGASVLPGAEQIRIVEDDIPDIMDILTAEEEMPSEPAAEDAESVAVEAEIPAEEEAAVEEEIPAEEEAEEVPAEEDVPAEEVVAAEAASEVEMPANAAEESAEELSEETMLQEFAEAEFAESYERESLEMDETETHTEPAVEECVEEAAAESEAEYNAEEKLPDIEEEIEDDLPQEVDEIEAILLAALDEENAEAEEKSKISPVKEKPAKEPVSKGNSKKEEPASNMIEDLERMLINELKNVNGQRLTEEQEKLFAYFTAVRGMNQQLSEFLEEEEKREKDGTSVTGNLVVTGESGTGKTTLAIDLVKAVQKQRQMKGSKMAKITGEALSQKDVAEVVRKLHGGALIVEHAGGITTEAAAKLSGAMLGQTGDLFVILEDEPAEIERLFVRCESLAAKFQKTIEIPVFTNNELVAFGKSYADEQGYVLDEMAVLALYNRIGNSQTSDHLVNVAEVKDIVDEAIERATKKGLAKIFAKRRQDEFGNYVLLEKDFEE